MKQLSTLVLMLMVSLASWAQMSGSCGDGLNYNAETKDGGKTYTLTISGSGWMKSYDYWASPEPVLPGWSEIREKITSVVVGEGVQSVGNHAFLECKALTSVSLPSTLQLIGSGAFFDCFALESISLPEGLQWMDQVAFFECKSLKSVVIPSSLTYIANEAFGSCVSLESVTLPATVTSIGYKSFDYCLKLTDVTLPDGLQSIGEWAFSDTAMPSVVIPGGVKNVSMAAFQRNPNLAMLVVSERNPNLTTLVVSEGVETIGGGTFGVCHQLATIVLPSTLNRIDDHAFMAWQKIKDFYCYASNVPETGDDIFMISYGEGHPDDLSGATLHVPAGSVTKYKKEAPWNSFGSIVALTSDDPTPSDISELPIQDTGETDVYYTIDGIRLQGQPTKKGVYIKDGKKVLVQ